MVYFRYSVSNLPRKQIVFLSFLSVCFDDSRQANKFSCKLFKENVRKHLILKEAAWIVYLAVLSSKENKLNEFSLQWAGRNGTLKTFVFIKLAKSAFGSSFYERHHFDPMQD